MSQHTKGIQSKLDLLSISSLKSMRLKDRSCRATALENSGDVTLVVQIRQERIVNLKLQHQEMIDQNTCVIAPKAIVQASGTAMSSPVNDHS